MSKNKDVICNHLIVLHAWWMDHKYWKKKVVYMTRIDAEKEAAYWKSQEENQFCYVTTLVMPFSMIIDD